MGGTLEPVSHTPASEPGTPAAARGTSERLGGLGRILIAVYIVLAIAATFRSLYQIISKFDEAPLAYSLSAMSGVVYIVATIALIMGIRGARTASGRRWRAIAWGALAFELVGVLIVGTLSIVAPDLFGHPSVWSMYGSGYLFIPLALPVLGLIWLRRTSPSRASSLPQNPEEDAS